MFGFGTKEAGAELFDSKGEEKVMKIGVIEAERTLSYILANEQRSAIKWMKRTVWGLFHAATLSFAIVTLLSIVHPHHSVASTVSSTSAVPTRAATTFSADGNSADPNKVLALVNNLRTENNLAPLAGDPLLTKLAEARADDMVNRQYYAHKNPDGKIFFDLMAESGYATQYACENLSLEPSKQESASYDSWLTSTHGHKECMLRTEVTRAGYASRKMYDIPTSKGMTAYYLVVAIHATDN